MTLASQGQKRRKPKPLMEASLLEAPLQLMRSIRGLSSRQGLIWLACVPVALFGLGVFNLAAHAAELPALTPAFLINNLWLLIAAILVIFMNAGFAMVEAGMCRQKNAVNILTKNLIVFALAASAYWLIGYSLMYGSAVIPGWLFFGKGGPFGLFFDPAVTPPRWSRTVHWCPVSTFSSRWPSPAPPPRSSRDWWPSGSSSGSSWSSR